MSGEKQYVLNLLNMGRSDNLARAWAAFRGADFATMTKEYGESGKTGFEVLADHILDEKRLREVIAWVQNLPDEA